MDRILVDPYVTVRPKAFESALYLSLIHICVRPYNLLRTRSLTIPTANRLQFHSYTS